MEKSYGRKKEGIPEPAGWTREMDNGLLWLRPHRGAVHPSQLGWWPGLEQKIVDLHARYERACVED